jgi:hypothetical protein
MTTPAFDGKDEDARRSVTPDNNDNIDDDVPAPLGGDDDAFLPTQPFRLCPPLSADFALCI